MSTCNEREHYLAGLLSGAEREAFEDHLAHCTQCASAVSGIRMAEAQVESWIADLPAAAPTAAEAARLVTAARERGAAFRIRRRLWALGLSAAACAAAMLLFIVRPWQPEPARQRLPSVTVLLSEGDGAGLREAAGERTRVEVPAQGRVVLRVNADRIGLAQDSRVELLPAGPGSTRLRLDRGVVAVDAGARTKGQALTVEAGGYLVRVVGTRFTVEHDQGRALRVKVCEGEVMVVSPDGQMRLVRAGRALSFDEEKNATMTSLTPNEEQAIRALLSDGNQVGLLPQPAESSDAASGKKTENGAISDTPAEASRPAQPHPQRKFHRPPGPNAGQLRTSDEIRAWIVSGAYERAQAALRQRISRGGAQAESWWLLAECSRKAKQPKQAAEAYEKVVALSAPAQANRARFQLAELLLGPLDEPGRAIVVLRAYLAQPTAAQPLSADAKLALARALERTGAKDESQRLLSEIVREHPGTSAGLQAIHLLEKGDR